MLDVLTIKQWLLVYFVALMGVGLGNLIVLLRIKAAMSMLMHESELVQYLKAIKRD